jgi:ABC-type methionine transport system ATPase subunit
MREQDMVRVQLNYPMDRVEEPILYRLVTDFGLVPNIRRANMDIRTGGFLFLELSGEREALRRALEWLTDYGIIINAIGMDGQEWAI